MIIEIRGEVTRKTADYVAALLSSNPEDAVDVVVDSVGGDLHAGLNIFNMLSTREDVNVHIEGVAGSIASVIALAGRKAPTISETGTIVIHNAHVVNVSGNHNDLERVRDMLTKYSNIIARIYNKKTGVDMKTLGDLMDKETVLDSTDAVNSGFASEVLNPVKALAKFAFNNNDMNLLEKVKMNLGLNEEGQVQNEAEAVAEVAEEASEGATFNEQQVEEIRRIVAEAIAEAMSGTEEEIGNTIATVLNNITSQGSAPQRAAVTEAKPAEAVDGVSAFYKKMNEIKNNNK